MSPLSLPFDVSPSLSPLPVNSVFVSQHLDYFHIKSLPPTKSNSNSILKTLQSHFKQVSMGFFSNYYFNPIPSGSDFWSPGMPESSSEECNDGNEVVLLASNHPKKCAGRKKFNETRHPVYRGVRRRNSDRWVCEVREPKKKSRIWLGTFPTPEMAARAHDVAVIALRGRSACLNFADSVWRLPVPISKDVKDIQKAATEAAKGFRPSKKEIAVALSENVFMDEEAVFGMPGLLANMAEGLMLRTSPSHFVGFGDEYSGDEMETNVEVSLWSYSI